MDFISEHFLDFDILCFTEAHLDANILSDAFILTDKFDVPHERIEQTMVGDYLIYQSHKRVIKRRSDLECFWRFSEIHRKRDRLKKEGSTHR